MKLSIKKAALIFAGLTMMLLVSIPAAAQRQRTLKRKKIVARMSVAPKIRLQNGESVDGYVDVDNYDGYIINARKGQMLTVRIRRASNVSLKISQTGNYYRAVQLGGGKFSNGGRRWTGKIPASGDYYIFVNARQPVNYKIIAKVVNTQSNTQHKQKLLNKRNGRLKYKRRF